MSVYDSVHTIKFLIWFQLLFWLFAESDFIIRAHSEEKNKLPTVFKLIYLTLNELNVRESLFMIQKHRALIP